MNQDDVIAKLKGIKALVYCLYNPDEEVEDIEYACMLLSQELDDCIQALSNPENR